MLSTTLDTYMHVRVIRNRESNKKFHTLNYEAKREKKIVFHQGSSGCLFILSSN